MFSYEHLTARQQAIYDAAEQQAPAEGRDTQDVLLEHPGDLDDKAHVAEVFGGPGAGAALREAVHRRTLDHAAQRSDSDEDLPVVRRLDDGRTAIVRAMYDGRSLLEYADGSREMVSACDTQQVGPDPDVMATAQALQDRADAARTAADLDMDPASAAVRHQTASQLQHAADDQRARAFDWMKPAERHDSDEF
ncbi:hypothetical protein [Couchioplanes caeruleus]|uniref:Uncharacterized protein n=2 Tax=Couchioplanes caeruleus TaxID=56438 RepID=A0A1K0GSV3_9ACTN|nr:hypothetical protein [Couchioplanes caeruleus]OJF15518.1 hypothetical protein BG844_04030 [Couchioplanes caeruleus subsp. caeruleus]ROP30943.1 hypothetical protein EDD30_3828 [Couchioplanes caeruleus]